MTSSPYTIILAGGRGRRLGGVDKGEIRLGQRRMIDVIAGRLLGQGARLRISGAHDYGLNVPAIPDREDGPQGPAAGLYAVCRALEYSDEAGFFTVPVDGPKVPEDLLTRLHRAGASAIAADATGLHPAFAWWRLCDLKAAWTDVDFNQSISLKKLVRMTQATSVGWPGQDSFVNINTSDDLAAYQTGYLGQP